MGNHAATDEARTEGDWGVFEFVKLGKVGRGRLVRWRDDWRDACSGMRGAGGRPCSGEVDV